ncbi:MAG: hypothetical protein MUC87_05435 [Bacteroidia bacterium]|jgi:hypothetical protein|nr:hypothetical protein [Bacteroidia bacterium]
MSIVEIEQIGALLIAGATKFLFAPAISEYFGYNFAQSFLYTTSGGVIGILAFTFVGDWLTAGWRKLITRIKALIMRRNPKAMLRIKPRRFTRTTRFIVRIRGKFGLVGLAIITPCIISIPIGTFVINRFYSKKWKILLALFTSLLLWSLILNYLAQTLHLSQYLNFSK